MKDALRLSHRSASSSHRSTSVSHDTRPHDQSRSDEWQQPPPLINAVSMPLAVAVSADLKAKPSDADIAEGVRSGPLEAAQDVGMEEGRRGGEERPEGGEAMVESYSEGFASLKESLEGRAY